MNIPNWVLQIQIHHSHRNLEDELMELTMNEELDKNQKYVDAKSCVFGNQ